MELLGEEVTAQRAAILYRYSPACPVVQLAWSNAVSFSFVVCAGSGGSARRGAMAALHRPALHARRRLYLSAGTDACVSLSRVRERGGRRANGDINVAVALYFDVGGDADEPAASPSAVPPADAASAHEDNVLEEQMAAFSMQVQQPPPSHHRPLARNARCVRPVLRIPCSRNVSVPHHPAPLSMTCRSQMPLTCATRKELAGLTRLAK